ncbi:MAG: DUF4959 domain-containing protein [Proteiniphilum sp.]|nr:DUF4959 domain-containing protein [Proteiniphilum sp.]
MSLKDYVMRYIYVLLITVFLMGIYSCEEESRFAISGDDKEAPNPPTDFSYKPLIGGVRVYYKIPDDKDILSVNAEYINNVGRKMIFSSSYFTDSLDVMGIADSLEHVLHLYAVDRAGNHSVHVPLTVKSTGSALHEVASSIEVLPAFNSFIVSWKNEFKQYLNVHVDMIFDKAGQRRNIKWVLSSKDEIGKKIIDNVVLSENESLEVNIQIEDEYGNKTQVIKMGDVPIMDDYELPKELWKVPASNDSIAGIPMCFGNAFEAKSTNVIDGIICYGETLNIMHTAGRGRTGKEEDGNAPWNYIIDLGDYYELSRIVTHQRHDNDGIPNDENVRGYYYMGENVKIYNMYFLDDETGEWEYISQHLIPTPTGLSELEFAKQGAAGDMALLYPDVPAFTKPTRWFRYEAISGFGASPSVLSEITLYGKKINNY